MEFTIEEMPAESLHQKSLFQKRGRFLKQILGDRKSIQRIIRWLKNVVEHLPSVRNPIFSILNNGTKLSARRELGVVLGVLLMILLSLIGKDIWQASIYKNQNSFLQQKLLQKTIERSTVGQQTSPFVDFLQQAWLKENAGNMRQLLTLLPALGRYFDESGEKMILTAFRKELKDPHFYIEGTSMQYDAIFRLEAFFMENRWKSTLTLDTDSKTADFKTFQLKVLPDFSATHSIVTK
ncbi:hypothetical protein [Ignatzschineria sp. LJL83]